MNLRLIQVCWTRDKNYNTQDAGPITTGLFLMNTLLQKPQKAVGVFSANISNKENGFVLKYNPDELIVHFWTLIFI